MEKTYSYITQQDYNILKQYFIEGMQPKNKLVQNNEKDLDLTRVS